MIGIMMTIIRRNKILNGFKEKENQHAHAYRLLWKPIPSVSVYKSFSTKMIPTIVVEIRNYFSPKSIIIHR